ncbi:hypothetical protein H6F88_18035 [Oculatella sp. FACHB-28]|uniref:hypothetical protein n=1 Tax=Oculatella sp. FACHB-28 TaxID=2692845 RepID=UPI00168998F3|nr:hypothetical protein [Oculatella sp. FACHB-28]MBD2057896.1 hypothetical protein [Oculatella sp. FACHB-28]
MSQTLIRQEMPKKTDRLQIPGIGEWYADLLRIDATINERSEPQQASSLLCSKLQEREPRIRERVKYLADKRGITFEEMWNDILTGKFEKLTPEEFAELKQLEQADS